MSQIPKDLKSKYNHDNKFLWVDAQLEKFMIRQKELENEITNLTGKIKNDMDYIKMLEESLEESKENALANSPCFSIEDLSSSVTILVLS